jgi:hypothetical protein
MPGFRVALASGCSPFGGNLDCSLATSALSMWNEVSGLQTEEVGQLDKWLPHWSDPTSPFPYSRSFTVLAAEDILPRANYRTTSTRRPV